MYRFNKQFTTKLRAKQSWQVVKYPFSHTYKIHCTIAFYCTLSFLLDFGFGFLFNFSTKLDAIWMIIRWSQFFLLIWSVSFFESLLLFRTHHCTTLYYTVLYCSHKFVGRFTDSTDLQVAQDLSGANPNSPTLR